MEENTSDEKQWDRGVDPYYVRLSKASVIASSIEVIFDMMRDQIWDEVEMQHDRYGDAATGNRMDVWRISVVISEAMR